MIYAVKNIFIFKKQSFLNALIFIFCGYLVYILKAYIFLTIIVALIGWVFNENSSRKTDIAQRRIYLAITSIGSAAIILLFFNYITSFENAKDYKANKILENAENIRQNFENVSEVGGGKDSHFSIETTNPVLLVLNGIVASFYRPFIWEVNSPIALLASLESAILTLLTLGFLLNRGIIKFFKIIFSDTKILFCFIFSFILAIAVGITSTNFGALSRYKIPALPFYLIMIILMYSYSNLPLPKWFKFILNLAVPPIKKINVRFSHARQYNKFMPVNTLSSKTSVKTNNSAK